jgi:hypothetical protein
MQKILLLAVIVAVATARTSVFSMTTNAGGAFSNINLIDKVFAIDWKYDIDVAYQNTWIGGPAPPQNGALNAIQKGFGINFNSHVNATVKFHFLDLMFCQVMFSFVPIDITPYSQVIIMNRPEDYILSGKPLEFTLQGTYDVHGLIFMTTITENFRLLEKSFYDFFIDMSNYKLYPTAIQDMVYDLTYEKNWEDPIWRFDPVPKYVQPNTDIMKWWGPHQYWSYSIINGQYTGWV